LIVRLVPNKFGNLAGKKFLQRRVRAGEASEPDKSGQPVVEIAGEGRGTNLGANMVRQADFTLSIGASRVSWRLRTQQEQQTEIAEANGVFREQSVAGMGSCDPRSDGGH
jgi:hypothetical protein